jgi:hypothetical protein
MSRQSVKIKHLFVYRRLAIYKLTFSFLPKKWQKKRCIVAEKKEENFLINKTTMQMCHPYPPLCLSIVRQTPQLHFICSIAAKAPSERWRRN